MAALRWAQEDDMPSDELGVVTTVPMGQQNALSSFSAVRSDPLPPLDSVAPAGPSGLSPQADAVWRDGSGLPLPTRTAKSQLLQRTRNEATMPYSISASPLTQRRLPIFSEFTSDS